jgi:hypothetical protein
VAAACFAASFFALRWFFSLNGGVPFDIAPIGNFFDLTVVNDTGSSVWIDTCADRRCRNRDGLHDTLKPGAARGAAAWLNDQHGIASVAVFARSGERCLRVRYREGQTEGRAYVSQAVRC